MKQRDKDRIVSNARELLATRQRVLSNNFLTVAYTGPRRGQTLQQQSRFRDIIVELRPGEFKHGLCVGGDGQAHDIVRMHFTSDECKIIGHPPTDKKDFEHRDCDVYAEAEDFLVRDLHMVQQSDILVATVPTFQEFRRSGTWTTVRYALKKANIDVIMIFPDGSTVRESPDGTIKQLFKAAGED
jgi:hypothetical protein